MREFNRAITLMENYVLLLPKEANPQDSYAEILRMAGRYEEAITHYRSALYIDPKFHSSQLGLADTFSLMGQQKLARQEYFRARVLAADRSTELADELQAALTYVRERDFAGAELAFDGVAQNAHNLGMPLFEAQALRLKATAKMLTRPADLIVGDPPQRPKKLFFGPKRQSDLDLMLPSLEQAEEILKLTSSISDADRLEERARILCLKAEWLAKVSRFRDAENALHELDSLVDESPSNDKIRRIFEGAQGAVLLYEQHYDDALPHLEQDVGNVYSMFRLAAVYQHMGQMGLAAQQTNLITAFSQPTADEAFVVPALREQILAESHASYRH